MGAQWARKIGIAANSQRQIPSLQRISVFGLTALGFNLCAARTEHHCKEYKNGSNNTLNIFNWTFQRQVLQYCLCRDSLLRFEM
jgi:hypothetical protein